jgi:argonaute-like protein implicated in RNA metabolism and viral defense
MFPYTLLNKSGFRFSPTNPAAIHDDRMRGILKFGPFRRVEKSPQIAFVFPKAYREAANTLYLALRNGIGFFKGMPTVFKVPLEKDQVIPISDFELRDRYNHRDSAARYRDAIQKWMNVHDQRPDIFITLHPKTMGWEDDSEYAATKAVLLREGLISQNVTFELIQSSIQFEWAAANIALALFAKLGGIPWAIDRVNAEDELIIGMGRSESIDVRTRQRQRFIAFTTCLQASGIYKFSTVGRVCDDEKQYMHELEATLRLSLSRALQIQPGIRILTLHFPKEFSFEERSLCQRVAIEQQSTISRTEFLKVSDEGRFFALDDESPDQVPRRGTCIRLSKSEHLLYTEGSEERQAWINRPPSAVRIRHYREDDDAESATRDLIGQVFDLSLANYRAFNARGYPVSILYSSLIGRVLHHADLTSAESDTLTDRMWFL